MEIDIREFEERIKEHVTHDDWSDCKVSISHNSMEAKASVKLVREYDFVEFDFEFLEMLSKLFKTKKINVGDRYAKDGCPTCNHGSSYEITFNLEKIGSME